MVVVISLAVGMAKAVVGSWWRVTPATLSEVEAAASDTSDDVSPREALMRSIIWVRATLPRTIDDQTNLVAVGLEGKVYWSRLVLDVNAVEMSENAKTAIRRTAVSDVCRRLGAAMRSDTISAYRADYVDRKRNPVETIEITKADCR
jgi:hypothetical protein